MTPRFIASAMVELRLQDELASQLADFQDQVNDGIETRAAQPALAAAAAPKEHKSRGNPLKHIITGQPLNPPTACSPLTA